MKILGPSRSVLLLILFAWSCWAFANQAPTVQDLVKILKEDKPSKIKLNGQDAESKKLSYSISQQPQYGSVTLKGKTATYKPNRDYVGADSFQYTALDGELTSTPATVNLTVQPVNDKPVSLAKSVTVLKDIATPIILFATDVDGDALTYLIGTKPKKAVSSWRAMWLPIPQKQVLQAKTGLLLKPKTAKPLQNLQKLP